MAQGSDVRLVDEEVHILGKRTRLKHRGENKIDLHPEGGNITLGGHGAEGDLIFRDGGTNTRIHVDASSGVPVGGDKLRMFFDGQNATVRLGGDGQPGSLRIEDSAGTETIRLDGEDADVVVGGQRLLERIRGLEARLEELEALDDER